MIAIYAEKFDVGNCCSLWRFWLWRYNCNNEKYCKAQTKLEQEMKRKGYIETSYNGKDYCITWDKVICGLKQAKDYNPEYAHGANAHAIFSWKLRNKNSWRRDRTTRKPTENLTLYAVRQLNIVRDIFAKCEYIINATDDDREGETIFAYVYEILRCTKPYKRLKIDSQEEDSLLYALDHLLDAKDVKGIEMAGRGRGIADWVVGANLSALMSLKYGNGQGVLSIGRVQTLY